jgi:hypothetical protein
MPKRIIIEPNLSLAELEARYRKSKDVVERTRWQVVWLLAQDKTTRSGLINTPDPAIMK